MLNLKNIKIDNGIISANYIPEDSEEVGFVSIDIKNGKVIDSVYTEYDGTLHAYFSHAVFALKKLIKEKEIPKERLVMWY